MKNWDDILTLGVNGPEAAREFYEGGFGADVGTEDHTLNDNLGPNGSCLALGVELGRRRRRGWCARAYERLQGVQPVRHS